MGLPARRRDRESLRAEQRRDRDGHADEGRRAPGHLRSPVRQRAIRARHRAGSRPRDAGDLRRGGRQRQAQHAQQVFEDGDEPELPAQDPPRVHRAAPPRADALRRRADRAGREHRQVPRRLRHPLRPRHAVRRRAVRDDHLQGRQPADRDRAPGRAGHRHRRQDSRGRGQRIAGRQARFVGQQVRRQCGRLGGRPGLHDQSRPGRRRHDRQHPRRGRQREHVHDARQPLRRDAGIGREGRVSRHRSRRLLDRVGEVGGRLRRRRAGSLRLLLQQLPRSDRQRRRGLAVHLAAQLGPPSDDDAMEAAFETIQDNEDYMRSLGELLERMSDVYLNEIRPFRKASNTKKAEYAIPVGRQGQGGRGRRGLHSSHRRRAGGCCRCLGVRIPTRDRGRRQLADPA